MPANIDERSTKVSPLSHLTSALEDGAFSQVKRILNQGLAPVDVAHLLESSPPKERRLLWELIEPDNEGDVLQHLSDEIRGDFINEMSPQELVDATSDLDIDDQADLFQQLPDTVIHEVLMVMDASDRQRVEAVLSYPEDSAGGLMDTDVVTIRPDISIDTVLRYLRRHHELPDTTDSIWVVNRNDELVGLLPITKMLISDPSKVVQDVMSTDVITIGADTSDTEVAQLFERHDLISAPVVDDKGLLLGRITIDDVVDVIREEADHSLLSMAGLDDEEDTFAPAMKTSRRRAIWLGVNLITAFIASFVIGLFSEALDKIVALAILMPIVASMGGIAGSQVLTLVIRGMALGHLDRGNLKWLLNRELAVGALNGVLWAMVIGSITYLWFGDWVMAMIIASAIIINLLVAALAGAILPVSLKVANIDPALAGSVILTTVTDVIGFLSFLGLATLIYL